jgi:hypothetical protein
MTWRLFIDDERFPSSKDYDMIIARSMEEVKNLVSDLGMPSFVSFDHDLGADEPTGYDIAKWMVDMDMGGAAKFPGPFRFYVHSQNPIGKKNIESYLTNYLAHIRED